VQSTCSRGVLLFLALPFLLACYGQTPRTSADRAIEEQMLLRIGDAQAAYELALSIVVRQSPEVQHAVYPYGVAARALILEANRALRLWLETPDILMEMEVEQAIRDAEQAVVTMKGKLP
jgi:hypothetical protein